MRGYDITHQADYAPVTIKLRDELSPWEPRAKRKRLPRKTKKAIRRYFWALIFKRYRRAVDVVVDMYEWVLAERDTGGSDAP